MKIAIIGSYNYKLPLAPGMIHAPLILAFNLALKLAERGHQVAYFGRVDEYYYKKHQNLKILTPEYFEIENLKEKFNCTDSVRYRVNFAYQQNYIAKILKDFKDYDIYYSWAASYIGPLAGLYNKPIAATHHDSTNMESYNLAFKGFDKNNLFIIPISSYMKSLIKYDSTLDIVHNGMDPSSLEVAEPKEYFCWLGRVSPSKGLHLAIQSAINAKVKLKIAGPMHTLLPDFGDISDYIANIKKLINQSSNIEYLGVLSHNESLKLISEAKALIFPTDGMESFSMVVLESIMSGTPVIATKRGPIPELVKENINGYLIDDRENIGEYLQAIKNIDKIDRQSCRNDAIERFSLDKMAEGYEEQFNIAILKHKKYCAG